MIKAITLTTGDVEKWRAVLPAKVSVSGCLEYIRICEQETCSAARLFVVEDDKPVAAYPYFLRPVNSLPIARDIGRPVFDTFTPEYGGPLWLSGGLSQRADTPRFPDLFARHCREQRIIAEFVHLNPWISDELLDPECIQPNREIIYVDLAQTEEQIWTRSLSSDARRQTKQGWRAGVRVRRSTSGDDARRFHRLYTQTMKRRGASDRYFYSLEYFLAFSETMSANAFFVMAEYKDRAVAGGLFIHDQNEIYWHLSAADREWSRVRPVNVYLFDTIRWALGQGWKRMILGGAYKDGDGVFRFKANYSPLRATFSTYQRVHDADSYTALTKAWHAYHGGAACCNGFFPLYRASPSVVAADGAAADSNSQ